MRQIQIQEELKIEKRQLEKIVQEARRRLTNAPEGHLHIKVRRGNVEYYQRENGKYISKREAELVRKIAQKDYDSSVVKCVEQRIKVIDLFLKKWERTALNNLTQGMNAHRQSLISPVVLSDEEYAEQWQNMEYTGKPYTEDTCEIITERGERVRSKSEKIIAEKLYQMGIPYRYECPLKFEDGMVIYPDFTILNVRMRREIYYEHFGLMDREEYVENMILKINTYGRNGICLGDNLIATFESGKNVLNSAVLEATLKKLV